MNTIATAAVCALLAGELPTTIPTPPPDSASLCAPVGMRWEPDRNHIPPTCGPSSSTTAFWEDASQRRTGQEITIQTDRVCGVEVLLENRNALESYVVVVLELRLGSWDGPLVKTSWLALEGNGRGSGGGALPVWAFFDFERYVDTIPGERYFVMLEAETIRGAGWWGGHCEDFDPATDSSGLPGHRWIQASHSSSFYTWGPNYAAPDKYLRIHGRGLDHIP